MTAGQVTEAGGGRNPAALDALDETRDYVAQLRSVLWPHLPTLLVSSVAVCAAAVVALLLTPGLTPVSVLVWALLVAPVFGALVAQANEMILGRDPGTFSIAAYARRTGRLALALGLPPAAAGACALAAVDVWRRTGNPLVLGSAAVGFVGAALLSIAAIAALPLGLELRSLRGLTLTMTALHIAARRPVPIFAVAAFGVAAVSLSAHLAASIMFLTPGPLALVLVVAVWTSAAESGVRPNGLENDG